MAVYLSTTLPLSTIRNVLIFDFPAKVFYIFKDQTSKR